MIIDTTTKHSETVLDTLDPELLSRVVNRRGAVGNISAAAAALAVA